MGDPDWESLRRGGGGYIPDSPWLPPPATDEKGGEERGTHKE